MKDPSLIDNDPELRREVDKLSRHGLFYQRKEEDWQRNDRRLAYYDDRVYLKWYGVKHERYMLCQSSPPLSQFEPQFRAYSERKCK